MGEVWVGLAIVAGLGLIAGWVAYKGAHPDPELFGRDPRLIPKGQSTTVVDERSGPRVGSGPSGEAAAPDLGRFVELGGPELAPEGFRVASSARFSPENLFEKINGREGFYKSRGFRALHFASLEAVEGDAVIDVEWFDLGTPAQALGAFSAERAEGAPVEAVPGGSQYLFRNMAAAVRGPNYIRLVGIDEAPGTQSALQALLRRIEGGLEGTEQPWSYAFFERLGVASGDVSIEPTDAFSFSFAQNVHVGLFEDEIELFVTPRPEGDAPAHAERFRKGFLSLGEAVGPRKVWIEDRYLSTFATAKARGADFVLGVRGAPDVKTGARLLEALGAELDALPETERTRALTPDAPSSAPAAEEDEYPEESAPAEEETY